MSQCSDTVGMATEIPVDSFLVTWHNPKKSGTVHWSTTIAIMGCVQLLGQAVK